jgi:acyltransferase
MGTQRLEYIDTMKGILIFFVVALHLPWVATMLCNYDCSLFEWSKHNTQFIGSYYMAAFFFVTGYCTNFAKELKIFVLQNIKTLLVPAVVFSFFDMIRGGYFSVVGLFFNGGAFWFLPALFWTKLIFYLLKRRMEGVTLAVAVVVLCAVGFLTKDFGIKNFWAIEHGLAFLPAIALGEWIKNKKVGKFEYAGILTFVIGYMACLLLNVNIPVLARTFKPVLSQMPLFLLFSCSGSLMILCLSKKITLLSNAVTKHLKFWGKNSLLIYLVSNMIMEYLLKAINLIIPDIYITNCGNVAFNSSMYLVVVLLTMLLFYPIVKLFDSKYLKWTLGKF